MGFPRSLLQRHENSRSENALWRTDAPAALTTQTSHWTPSRSSSRTGQLKNSLSTDRISALFDTSSPQAAGYNHVMLRRSCEGEGKARQGKARQGEAKAGQ